MVNFPLLLLHISFQISYKKLVLDQDNNFCLICSSILITYLLDNVWNCREKLDVNHFWELKG